MGYQNQGSRNLVVMTNKDVHFITKNEVAILAAKIADKEPLHSFIDVQSLAEVFIQVPNVSTIVVEGSQND
jgi:hypothetical protein